MKNKGLIIYGTTDCHFGHKRFEQQGFTTRPKDYEDKILASIRSKTGDMLVNTGDFCFGNDEEWCEKYMDAAKNFDQKVLVRGNHDPKSDSWYYRHGFTFVAEAIRLKVEGKVVLFTHCPVGMKDEKDEFWLPMWPHDVNIHGHYHGTTGSLYDHTVKYDMAPETHKCQVVSINSLVSKFETRGYKKKLLDRKNDLSDKRNE